MILFEKKRVNKTPPTNTVLAYWSVCKLQSGVGIEHVHASRDVRKAWIKEWRVSWIEKWGVSKEWEEEEAVMKECTWKGDTTKAFMLGLSELAYIFAGAVILGAPCQGRWRRSRAGLAQASVSAGATHKEVWERRQGKEKVVVVDTLTSGCQDFREVEEIKF